eukprot:scaffold5388_cov20-Prasinocladus_malaysianus.AAC.1
MPYYFKLDVCDDGHKCQVVRQLHACASTASNNASVDIKGLADAIISRTQRANEVKNSLYTSC